MGYQTAIFKPDGTKLLLKSHSLEELRRIRSAECQKLIGQQIYVAPIIKDHKPFTFSMRWSIKPKRGVKG